MATSKYELCGGTIEINSNETVAKQTISIEGNTNKITLLKRVFMFLEDGNWSAADQYCEKVLDIDPECADAYLGKLLAELKVHKKEQLRDCKNTFEERNNCQKAMRFGDEAFSAFVKDCTKYINERNENERLTSLYNNAVSRMNSANTETELKSAAALFDEIKGFKDSEVLSKQCLEKAEISRKDTILNEAKSWMIKAVTIHGCNRAIGMFESISGWKDADEQIIACQRKIEDFKAKESDRLECERKAEIARKEAEKRAKRNKKILIIAASVLCLVIAAIIIFNMFFLPGLRYDEAKELFEQGDYDEAYKLFYKVASYEDSKEHLSKLQVIYDKRIIYSNGNIEEYTYDSYGNMLSWVTKDSGGNIEESYEYTYDSYGNMLSSVTKDSGGKVERSNEYTYDSYGNRLSWVRKDSGGKVIVSYEYTYDSYGNMLSWVTKDSGGKVERSIEYTYDSYGNELSRVEKDSGGKVKESDEFTYDSYGNMLSWVTKDSGGKVERSIEYTYDSYGNMLSSVRKDSGGEAVSEEFDYENVRVILIPQTSKN